MTGTSVAAAEVAGAAALLAQARPGLSATDLASLLAGSARPFGAGAAAAGAGLVDPGASAVGEVSAGDDVARLRALDGAALAPEAAARRFATSPAAPLILTLASSSRLVDVEPASLQLDPGQTATVQVTAARLVAPGACRRQRQR